jgi:hypothetical protein
MKSTKIFTRHTSRPKRPPMRKRSNPLPQGVKNFLKRVDNIPETWYNINILKERRKRNAEL